MEDWLKFIRALPRPLLTILFPFTVLIIGGFAAFKFLGIAVQFIDREIAMIIIVAILSFVTGIGATSASIVSFMFGERAAKKKEDK